MDGKQTEIAEHLRGIAPRIEAAGLVGGVTVTVAAHYIDRLHDELSKLEETVKNKAETIVRLEAELAETIKDFVR